LKRTHFKIYIFYALIIAFFMIFSSYISNKFLYIANITFQPGFIKIPLFIILLFFGILLGFESLINEKRKIGKWGLNISRLIIIGIFPLLIIIWYWFPILFSLEVIKVSLPYFFFNDIFHNFPVILFGWTLATSIYKIDSI